MLFAYIFIVIISLCYLSMVFVFTLGLAKASNKSIHVKEPSVYFSIILTLRNEEHNVNALVKSILNQVYPSELIELILINDHSTDNTLRMISEWAKSRKNISIINLPNSIEGKKQAIAMGVGASKNDLIVLTDADCVHPTTWLKTIANRYVETNASLIIGPVMLAPPNSIFQKMQALEHASLTASSIGACAMGVPIMASSANLAFSKKELGFKPDMMNLNLSSGDDVFLLQSAKRLKKRISFIHNPMGLVTSKPSKTVKGFFTQRARWASKAKAYKDIAGISVAVIVLLFNLQIIGLFLAAMFFPSLWILVLVVLHFKLIVDFPLLLTFLNRYSAKSLLRFYLPLQIVYPFYIMIAFLQSILLKIEWKGRVVRN